MEAVGELGQGELARRVEDYRIAYQDRDVGRMLALFADDAELTVAPGTFRGTVERNLLTDRGNP